MQKPGGRARIATTGRVRGQSPFERLRRCDVEIVGRLVERQEGGPAQLEQRESGAPLADLPLDSSNPTSQSTQFISFQRAPWRPLQPAPLSRHTSRTPTAQQSRARRGFVKKYPTITRAPSTTSPCPHARKPADPGARSGSCPNRSGRRSPRADKSDLAVERLQKIGDDGQRLCPQHDGARNQTAAQSDHLHLLSTARSGASFSSSKCRKRVSLALAREANFALSAAHCLYCRMVSTSAWRCS